MDIMHRGFLFALFTCIWSAVNFVRANDVLFVVDLAVAEGELVESAPIDVPEGYAVGFLFYSSNRNASSAFYQGVKVELPGAKFVVTDQPDHLPLPASPFADAPRINTNSYSLGLGIVGPCQISAFASNAPARLQVYLSLQDERDAYGYLLGTNVHVVEVPKGSFLTRGQFAHLSRLVTFPNELVMTNYYWISRYEPYSYVSSWGQVLTNSSQSVNSPRTVVWPTPSSTARIPSSVVTDAFLTRGGGIDPINDIAGPATVRFERPSLSFGTNSIGWYSYRLVPVNLNYRTNNSNGEHSAPPSELSSPAPLSVFVERSSDGSSWSQVDSFHVTETAGQAFYRVRTAQGSQEPESILGALQVTNGRARSMALGLPADNDPAGDGLSHRAKYVLRDLGADWENPQIPAPSVVLAANELGLFSKSQKQEERQAGREDVLSKPSKFDLFTQSQYKANRLLGRRDVTNSPLSFSLYTKAQLDSTRMAGRRDVTGKPGAYGLVARRSIPPVRISTQRGNDFKISLPGSWTRYAQSGALRSWRFDSKRGVLTGTMPRRGSPNVRITPYRGAEAGPQITVQFRPTGK
jgi:hypothetical protein